MKKIKIVLAVASMLAIVGGALAFKVTKYGTEYCIGVSYIEGIATSDCPDEVSSTIEPNPTVIVVYGKIKPPLLGCQNQICPSIFLAPE